MDFRITKIKTQAENFGSPISVSLAEIVNRMKDENLIPMVDHISQSVTQALIEQKERGYSMMSVASKHDLPYLIFSATFGRQGLQDFRQPTGLVLLSVDYGLDIQQMQTIREQAIQLPQTVLVFRSVSRASPRTETCR